MINKSVLVKAIEGRKAGEFPNFSNIELNQAVDLVLFENFNIDVVCQMTSEELDMASNPDEEEFGNSEDWYTCPNCGKRVYIPYDGERDEAFIGSCECNEKFYVSCYGMDDYQESLTEEECENFNEHDYVQTSINAQFNWKKEIANKNAIANKLREEKKAEVKDIVIYDIYDKNELSVRAYNCLKRAGYTTLNEVNAKVKSIDDLLKIRNLGRNATKEVIVVLKKYFNVSYEF